MGMESWFKKKTPERKTVVEQVAEDARNEERARKAGIGVAFTAAAAVGAAAGADQALHDQSRGSVEPTPSFDTLPEGFENPTAGKQAGDGPDPIVLPHNQ